MMDRKAKVHFEKAAKHLKSANQELYKPIEDVVSLPVCQNALLSIENNLRGFLAQRGFETRETESIDHLLKRCQMLDKRFQSINLVNIDCRHMHKSNRYCEDIEKVNSCFESADRLENFLKQQHII